MGNCNSVLCSEENYMITMHKRRNEVRLRQAAGTKPNVSSSVQILDIESTDESLSDSSSSSTLSDSESNIALPQEDLEALEIRGTPWPPSRDVDARKEKQGNKKFSFSPKKEDPLERDTKTGQSDSRNSTPKESNSAPHAPVRHFSYTGPPPRPSPWKEVYLTMIKPKEELADESLQRQEGKSRVKKKHINRDEKIRALRKQLAKKIDSIKRKTSYIRRRNTPEDQIVGQESLGVAECGGEMSDERSSTSASPASTGASSATSSGTSIISDDSFDESSIGCYSRADDDSTVERLYNGEKDAAGKSHKLRSQKQNKVSPM